MSPQSGARVIAALWLLFSLGLVLIGLVTSAGPLVFMGWVIGACSGFALAVSPSEPASVYARPSPTDRPHYDCALCGRRSFHPEDVDHEYCSCCGSRIAREQRALSAIDSGRQPLGMVVMSRKWGARGATRRAPGTKGGSGLPCTKQTYPYRDTRTSAKSRMRHGHAD